MGVEHTHTTLLKLEVFHTQVCMSSKMTEKRGCLCLSCGFSAEFDRMEIYQVKDIIYLHLVEIDSKGVCGIAGGYTIYDNVFLSAMDVKMIYQQIVFAIENVRGLHIPSSIVQDNM